VFPERPGETHLELGWSDGRTVVDRDTEIALEILCDHVSAALERIERAEEPSFLAKVVNLRG
jgi:UDP-GlcNAc:undecaprenyl-phosphate GlcNAc-1-phosphate transferase